MIVQLHRLIDLRHYSLFLHWQIFHTTVMLLPSHPDPGRIVIISIFITSLIHVMTAGHRWILAQFHYDLIYTHVICNQIKKRYYHKSVHISSHICSQVLHWSELCWKVGKTFSVVYFCVVKENTQFDLIYPLGLVWRGQGARVTDGDMGKHPDQKTRNYPGSKQQIVNFYKLLWTLLFSSCCFCFRIIF